MDSFQATSGQELTDLRSDSAAMYSDQILQAVARHLSETGGSASVNKFRDLALEAIAGSDGGDRHGDMLRALAVEEVNRVVHLAYEGSTTLRGWTTDGPAAVEEQK
jgi:hypothetical protein